LVVDGAGIGLAEGYMAGEWVAEPGVKQLLCLLIDERRRKEGAQRWVIYLKY